MLGRPLIRRVLVIAAFLLFGWLFGGAQTAQATAAPATPNQSSAGDLTGGDALDLAAEVIGPRRSVPAHPGATPTPPGAGRPSAHRPPHRTGHPADATPRARTARDQGDPTGGGASTRGPDVRVGRSRDSLGLPRPTPAPPGPAQRIELTPAAPTPGGTGAAADPPLPLARGPLTGMVSTVRRAGTVPLVPAVRSLSSELTGPTTPPTGQDILGLVDDGSAFALSVLETYGSLEKSATAGALRPGATDPRHPPEPALSGPALSGPVPPASRAWMRTGPPDTPNPPAAPGNSKEGQGPSLKPPAPDPVVGDVTRARVSRPDGEPEPAWHVLTPAHDTAAGDRMVSPD